jgi:RimJ/RimL family protein N-acetyltransferase
MVKGARDGQLEEFFRTARLIFRPFEAEDLDALAGIVSDPEVVRFTDDGQPLSREMTELWITRSRQNVRRFGYGTGAVVEHRTGRLVGWAGFARPEGAPEEIIYGFEQATWRKGYGSEIVQGLIRFAFDKLDLTELRASAYPGNAVSTRILQKCGFQSVPSNKSDAILFVLAKPTS